MKIVLTLYIATIYIQAKGLSDTVLESDQIEPGSQQVTNDQDLIRPIRNALSTAVTLIPQVGAFFGKLLRPLLGGLASRTNSEYNDRVINKFIPRALKPQRFFVNSEKYTT